MSKVLKIGRELKLFESDREKREKFQVISEDYDDFRYQKEIVAVLENIGFENALVEHMNKHLAMNTSLKRLKRYVAGDEQHLGDSSGCSSHASFSNSSVSQLSHGIVVSDIETQENGRRFLSVTKPSKQKAPNSRKGTQSARPTSKFSTRSVHVSPKK